MRRERIYQVSVDGMDGVVLEYYMTVDDTSASDPFGISIVKRSQTDTTEEYVAVDHIGADRQEISRLIDCLAQGETFPVSLGEIVDDYLARNDFEF